MMRDYRLVIDPVTSFLTPLDSDTIFGSLCWIIRYLHGESFLKDYLEDFSDEPSLLVSCGFPHDTLPFPSGVGLSRREVRQLVQDLYGEITPSSMREAIVLIKKIKKIEYLPLQIFRDHVQSFSEKEIVRFYLHEGHIDKNLDPSFYTEQEVYRNRINRLTNQTEEGSLFSLIEMYYHQLVDIYFRFPEDQFSFYTELLHAFEIEGFGSKNSTGKGQFKIKEFVPFELPRATDPNYFMTLSNYIPGHRVVEGYYRIKTKRGKIGSSFASSGYSPWKTPLLMYRPGSIFKIDSRDPIDKGKLVGEIHHQLPEIVQSCYAYDMEVRIGG